MYIIKKWILTSLCVFGLLVCCTQFSFAAKEISGTVIKNSDIKMNKDSDLKIRRRFLDKSIHKIEKKQLANKRTSRLSVYSSKISKGKSTSEEIDVENR